MGGSTPSFPGLRYGWLTAEYQHHKRPHEEYRPAPSPGAERARGGSRSERLWLGPNSSTCADQITIADYFGGCLATLGEVIRCEFSAYPNVERWLNNLRKLKSWNKVNEAHYGYQNAVKEQPFKVL